MFRAFRCVWMLEELGVPYEHILAKPWGKTAKRHHPQGKIPVLIDGDFEVYESAVINTYLSDKYNSPLVPSQDNIQERAKYNQTVLVIMTDMDAQGLWMHRKHEALSQYFGSSPEAVKEAKRQFDAVKQVLVTQLSQPGPYLLGTNFSAADILYIHCLDWAKSIGWFHPPTPEQNDEDYGIVKLLGLMQVSTGLSTNGCQTKGRTRRSGEEAEFQDVKVFQVGNYRLFSMERIQ